MRTPDGAGGNGTGHWRTLLASRLGDPITAINQISLRQAVTPNAVLGRVDGAMLTVGLGAAPVGALLGGLLGDAIGLRLAIIVGALGIQLGFVRLLRSPLRSLRAAPAPPSDPSAAA